MKSSPMRGLKRARGISADLRCLVCQSESIDNSNADLAKTLRLLVRERLVAGDSDDEVVDYIVARYGEYVLLKPVFSMHTLLLWLSGPLALFLGGGIIWYMIYRPQHDDDKGDDDNIVDDNNPQSHSTTLSEAEQKALTTILQKSE